MESSKQEMIQFVQSSAQFTDERTFLLKLSFFWKIIIWFSVTISLITGWIAKFVIYLHIFKTNIKDQPINALILIEELVHHFCGNFNLVSYTFSIPLGLSIGEMIEKYFGNVVSGNMYCWIYFYVQNINVVYRGLDGLGIAVFRFLYIKNGAWLKYQCGERSFLACVTITIWVISCIMIYLFGSENVSNRSNYNMCMGHNQAFEVFFKFLNYLKGPS